MTRLFSTLFLFLFCAIAPSSLSAQNIVFTESAEYDSANERFLLSNSNNILARDNAGNFSVFGSGSASHGMEILGNTLFALEGSVLKGFDLTTETQVMTLNIVGSNFLNGITNDGVDKLWVTDFSGGAVYQIDVSDLNNPSFELFVNTPGLTPNGIIYDEDNARLLFVTWGSNASVIAIDLASKQLSTVVTTNLGNIDGIVQDSLGQYYLSSWSPDIISVYDEDFANSPTTLTTPTLDSPADLGLANEPGILAIPMGGSIVFVDLDLGQDTSTTAIVEAADASIRLGLQGNPLTEASLVYYELENATDVAIQIIDVQGQVQQALYQGKQNPGKHWISLAGMDLPAGIYVVQLQAAQTILNQTLIVASPGLH